MAENQYEEAWRILEDELYDEKFPFDPYSEEDPSETYYAHVGSSMTDQEIWEEIQEKLKEFDNNEENSWTEYCDVNSPSHYKRDGIESIQVIDAFVPDPYSFYMGNTVKYVLRHMDKGSPKKDLRKAKWYLERMIADYE